MSLNTPIETNLRQDTISQISRMADEIHLWAKSFRVDSFNVAPEAIAGSNNLLLELTTRKLKLLHPEIEFSVQANTLMTWMWYLSYFASPNQELFLGLIAEQADILNDTRLKAWHDELVRLEVDPLDEALKASLQMLLVTAIALVVVVTYQEVNAGRVNIPGITGFMRSGVNYNPMNSNPYELH